MAATDGGINKKLFRTTDGFTTWSWANAPTGVWRYINLGSVDGKYWCVGKNQILLVLQTNSDDETRDVLYSLMFLFSLPFLQTGTRATMTRMGWEGP